MEQNSRKGKDTRKKGEVKWELREGREERVGGGKDKREAKRKVPFVCMW